MIFEAVVGPGVRRNIAIDDLTVVDGPCPPTGSNYSVKMDADCVCGYQPWTVHVSVLNRFLWLWNGPLWLGKQSSCPLPVWSGLGLALGSECWGSKIWPHDGYCSGYVITLHPQMTLFMLEFQYHFCPCTVLYFHFLIPLLLFIRLQMLFHIKTLFGQQEDKCCSNAVIMTACDGFLEKTR